MERLRIISLRLAEILGVSVTELLEGRYIEQGEELNAERLVQKVIELNDSARACPENKMKRIWIYALSLLLSVLELLGLRALSIDWTEIYSGLGTIMLFALIFGAYFCLFAKDRLPAYYDEDKIST